MPDLRFYKTIPVFENIFHIFYFLPHEDYTTALPRPKAFYFDIIRQTPINRVANVFISRMPRDHDFTIMRILLSRRTKNRDQLRKLYPQLRHRSRQTVYCCIYFTSKVLAIFSLPLISSTSMQISAVFPIAASTNFIPPSTKSGDNL